MRIRFLLLAAFLAARLANAAVPDAAWTVDTAGQFPFAVAAAPDGSIVTLSLRDDCVVVTKRSHLTGAETWSKSRCGINSFGHDVLAVDRAGNVSVVSRSVAGDAVAVKYRADGSLAWDRTVLTFASVWNTAVDSQGNVFAVGTYNSDQAFVAKVDGASGNLAWSASFVGGARRVAVDPEGNAIVGGQLGPLNPISERAGLVAKYSASSGSLLWQAKFTADDGSRFPEVLAMAPDGGVVVAGGHNVRSYNRAFTTLKLAGADGRVQWQRDYDTDGDDYALAVAVGPNGEVAATGASENKMMTFAYSSDGDIRWQRAYVSAFGFYDRGAAVAFDGNGDVIATGRLQRDPNNSAVTTVLRTIKYGGSDGSEIWSVGSGAIDMRLYFSGMVTTPAGVVLYAQKNEGPGSGARVQALNADAEAPRNYQGLWWNSPPGSENGWGMNVAHQGDTLFITWFTYDYDFKAMWLVMPDARNVFGHTYYGKLYRTRGPAFDSVPFDPARVVIRSYDDAYIDFSDSSNGTFTFYADRKYEKPITRQIFDARMPSCTSSSQGGEPSYQDLWWASPAGSESGWGVNLTHQGDILFATWFTYDATGRDMWIVGPRLEKVGEGTYAGPLYRTSGSSFVIDVWPATINVTQVGNATFTFGDVNHGTFAYTVDGKSQSKPITRQHFGTPMTSCEFVAP